MAGSEFHLTLCPSPPPAPLISFLVSSSTPLAQHTSKINTQLAISRVIRFRHQPDWTLVDERTIFLPVAGLAIVADIQPYGAGKPILQTLDPKT